VISGAEFWEKYALLMKKNNFYFALKEKGKSCCIHTECMDKD
jgi:hypothetical protein